MQINKQELFLELYEPIHPQFERFCKARVFGDMDYRDLMNETLLIAYQKFDTLRSKESFLSFLFGICVRIIGNDLQKKKTERWNESESILNLRDLNSGPQEQVDIYFLNQALSKLVSEQRESVILFEIVGLSIKEIMEIQRVSESAVKQRLKRGRERLTELLTYEAILTKEEVNNA